MARLPLITMGRWISLGSATMAAIKDSSDRDLSFKFWSLYAASEERSSSLGVIASLDNTACMAAVSGASLRYKNTSGEMPLSSNKARVSRDLEQRGLCQI